MKIYEDFRRAVSNDRLYCPECGQANPRGNEVCAECETTLLQPVSMLQNVLDVVGRPMRGMKRVAATAPILQALLIVLAGTAIQLLIEALSLSQFWQYYYDNPDKRTDQFVTAFNDKKLPAHSFEPTQFILALVIFTASWVLFAGAIILVARLFYKQQGRLNYNPVLAVVGFARLAYLALLVILATLSFVPSLVEVGNILALLPLFWQLALLIIGVRFATGLNWNRSALVVAVPAILFIFLLPGLIGLQLPL